MSAAALDLSKYPPEVRASIEFQAPPKLSNTAFLAAIFADAQPPETLWTCHFAGSPDADAPWKGAPLTPGEAAPDRADHNTYFSVASLVPDASGEIRRRLSSFGRLFALVLDDAGSVPGIDPTWILETSKPNGRSNRQVGYRLSEPVGDVDLARRVHQALAAAGHIPSDKSGNNPVRYVRLPVGSNTKHNPPHAHKLLSWHPERAYPVETLIQALRLELDPPPRNEQREPPSEDLSGRSFFAKVNTKALARPEAWVPELFPSAKPYQGGYRVASKDLGRALEEDISVHPSGIRDFGTEEPKTAIDLAMEWGTPTTALEAARWLCDRLGIDPASLGMGAKSERKERAEAPGSEAGGDTWPAPQPIPETLYPVEPFDLALLPESLRGWIADGAERMQCPPDFPAVGGMVALSSVVGRKCVVRPKRFDDWEVVPNLWGGVVGRPGIMKSPALSFALNPLDRLQVGARDAFRVESSQYENTEMIRDMQAKAAKDKAQKLVKSGKITEAEDALRATGIEDDQAPILRRYKVTDTTVEALGEILMENPWGVLAYRDELYGLLRGLDKEGQEGSRAFYLQGYDGNQGYTFDRIMRGRNLHIDAVCISMLGGIQPGKLKSFIREAVTEGSGDDGLLQRFSMLVWPDPSRDWKNVDRWPDTAAKTRAFEVFERLDRIEPDTDPSTGAGVSLVFCLSDAAQELFDDWRATNLEPRLRDGSMHPALESHLAKYRKLVPAVALVCALAEGEDTVSERSMLLSLAWAEYLESHARRIYGAGTGPDVDGAKALLGKIRARALCDGFKASDIYLKGWSGLSSVQATRDALRILCDLGYLRMVATKPGPSGGRPSEAYQINPAVFAEV